MLGQLLQNKSDLLQALWCFVLYRPLRRIAGSVFTVEIAGPKLDYCTDAGMVVPLLDMKTCVCCVKCYQ